MLPANVLIVRGDPNSKKVALTFDDGPDEMTPKYVEVLESLNVKATFFLLGKQIEKFSYYAQMLAEHGHEVAGHGMTHKTFPKLNAHELNEELENLKVLLHGIVSSNPRLVRPPHGTSSIRSLVQSCLNGYSTVLWSIASDDTTPANCDRLLAEAKNGKIGGGDIILLHEGQESTLKLLPQLVGQLRACGLEPTTVSELQ